MIVDTTWFQIFRSETNMRSRNLYPVVAVLLSMVGLLLASPPAANAGGLELEQFQPMADQQHNYLSAPSTVIAPEGQWLGMTMLNVANDPLVLRDGEDERATSLVSSQSTLHLMGSFAIFDWLELGLDIPLFLHQGGTATPPPGVAPVESRRGIGDVRLTSKARLFDTDADEDEIEFAVAGILDTHVPTGNSDHLQGGDFRIGPTVAAELIFPDGHRVGTHLGYQFRPSTTVHDLEVNDTVGWGVAGEVAVHDEVWVLGEVTGRITPAAGLDRAHSPTEIRSGVKSDLGPTYVVGGLGVGLVRGYGTPDWRAFLGIGLPIEPAEEPEPIVRREPPPEPEPEPAPEPEPEPELEVNLEITSIEEDATLDDFLVTVAGTSTPNAQIRVQLRLGSTKTSLETVTDDDGQWSMETLLDEDGEYAAEVVATHPEDAEVTRREAMSFSVAGDHCAHDELYDCHEFALCINEPGDTYDCECQEGYVGDGAHCEPEPEPEPKPEPAAELDEETQQIEITDAIHFATASDEIDPRSFRILDDVAQILEENPQVERVRIEGHTDNQGARDYNINLSQERADSVRAYLVEEGIEADRLITRGFGPDEPVADNDTEEGRALNRRVEFHILGAEPESEDDR